MLLSVKTTVTVLFYYCTCITIMSSMVGANCDSAGGWEQGAIGRGGFGTGRGRSVAGACI